MKRFWKQSLRSLASERLRLVCSPICTPATPQLATYTHVPVWRNTWEWTLGVRFQAFPKFRKKAALLVPASLGENLHKQGCILTEATAR